ncbi:acyltransferase family protein [Paenibacillus azoreducens]
MIDNTRLFRQQNFHRMSSLQRTNSKRYMPGIDGLRALSVLAVIAYHLNLKWAQGGLLGVGIFFVISGYLITDQIVNEWKKNDSLDLMNFWIRRARRLLPAMIAMLLFVALWLLCIDASRLEALKGDYLSSLFYFNNWYLIFHEVSYFESFGPASPIGHLWSLSIEEQFYVVWPLLLVFGLKLTRRRRKLVLMILGLAAVSALAMAITYVPGTDPSRVYYGTDTRAFALLIGAALAIVWPSQKLSEQVSGVARGVLDITGVLGIAVLLVLMNRINEYDDSLYRGGFVLVSFITAAVIAVLAHPSSFVGRIMGLRPLRWVGIRSYSLYIWHYPVIILTSPAVNTDGISVGRIILQLAASLILSALSFKYIEEPLRRGRFRESRAHGFPVRRRRHRRRLRPVILAAILLVIFIPLACNANLSNSKAPVENEEAGEIQQSLGSNESNAMHQQIESPNKGETSNPSKSTTEINETKKTEETSVSSASDNPHRSETKKSITAGIQSGEGITAIGDSVILDAKPFLEKMLPGIVVNGKVGRQMRQAKDVVDQLKAGGKMGDRVIIELGTNGPFNTKQLRELLQSLDGAKQIILVNSRVPRNWQDTVNAAIEKVSKEFSNTTVVDWYSASEGKDDYFYRDGVHLKREGAEFYATILVNAIRGKE